MVSEGQIKPWKICSPKGKAGRILLSFYILNFKVLLSAIQDMQPCWKQQLIHDLEGKEI